MHLPQHNLATISGKEATKCWLDALLYVAVTRRSG
jgi:hypothetical protein